jgi:hypothetical protein
VERLLGLYRVTSSAVAAVLLVVVNLVPLAGAVWWDWDLMAILALYWVENGIVGAINVLKILRAEGSMLGGMQMRLNGRPISSLARRPIAAFFLIHYGGFWVGHGLFVLLFLPAISGSLVSGGIVNPDGTISTPLLSPFGPGPDWAVVALGALGLAISHGTSFWLNYLGRGEYRSVSPAQLMLAPYGRLVILHLTIILGAMLSIWIGSPVGSLLLLVILKTALDLVFHLREHRRAATVAPLLSPS